MVLKEEPSCSTQLRHRAGPAAWGASSPRAANRPTHPLNQGPAVHREQRGQLNTPALVHRGFELAFTSALASGTPLSRWIPFHISAPKIQEPVTQLLSVLTCLGTSNIVMLVQSKAYLMNNWHLHGISCFQTGVIT